MGFELVPALQQKEFICDLPFCRVLMEDNANFSAFLALYKFHFYGILYGRKLHFYALVDA